jgi:hypothetical protein
LTLDVLTIWASSCLHHQRQEGAHAEIDAAPADVEGALPLIARAGEQAAAAADAGIVEQQMDLVGCPAARSVRRESA